MLPIIALFAFAALGLVFGGDDSVDDPAPVEPNQDFRPQNQPSEDRQPEPQDDDPDGLDGTDFDEFDAPVQSFLSGPQDGYNIEIDFVGDWSLEEQKGIIEAAEYISTIVVEDIPDFGAIDDLKITATIGNIDGESGILAYAGVDTMRGGSFLPASGYMTFDKADVTNLIENDTWKSTALHEMLHSLGFGVAWDEMGLINGSVQSGDLRFTGENATKVYKEEMTQSFGDSRSDVGVPIETDGGSGTAGSHWDEATFGPEIMTGYLDQNDYVSELTLATLEDMGYDTLFDDPTKFGDAKGQLPAFLTA